uniref:Uncharacterized protein n=1 Tax=Arundo donax TaxID=35708 RepID=A0A0A9FGB5_ARUDO
MFIFVPPMVSLFLIPPAIVTL